MRRIKISYTIPVGKIKDGEVVQEGEETITILGRFHKWVHTLSYEPTPRPIVKALIEKDNGYVNTYHLEDIQFIEEKEDGKD